MCIYILIGHIMRLTCQVSCLSLEVVGGHEEVLQNDRLSATGGRVRGNTTTADHPLRTAIAAGRGEAAGGAGAEGPENVAEPSI